MKKRQAKKVINEKARAKSRGARQPKYKVSTIRSSIEALSRSCYKEIDKAKWCQTMFDLVLTKKVFG